MNNIFIHFLAANLIFAPLLGVSAYANSDEDKIGSQSDFAKKFAETIKILEADGIIKHKKSIEGLNALLPTLDGGQEVLLNMQALGVVLKLNDPNRAKEREASIGGYVGDGKDVIDAKQALERNSFYGILLTGPAQAGKTKLVNAVASKIEDDVTNGNPIAKDTFFLPVTTFGWKDKSIIGVIERFFSLGLKKLIKSVESKFGSEQIVIHLTDFSNLLDCQMSQELCQMVARKFEDEFLSFNRSSYAGKVKFVFEVEDSLSAQFSEILPKLAAKLHRVDIKEPSTESILASILERQDVFKVPFESEAVLAELIENGKNLFPKQSKLQAAESAIEDIQLKALEEGVETITSKFLFDSTQDSLGLPFNPRDPESREAFRTEMIAYLSSKVMNQDHAIREVVDAVVEFYSDPKAKVFPVILMGSTGIGKTYLIQLLAEKLFDADSLLMDIAGSQFSTDDNRDLAASILVGSQTSSEPGSITGFLDKIRGRGGVLLLDEYEKFARYYHILFMELFDKGVLMAPDGPHYATKLLVFLATNKGVDEIYQGGEVYNVSDLKEEQLKKFFSLSSGVNAKEGNVPDEIIGRIAKWIALNQHEAKHAVQVALRELVPVIEELAKQGYEVSFSENLIAAMVLSVFSPEYGVRRIKKMKEKFRDWVYEVIRQADIPMGSRIPLDIEPVGTTSKSRVIYTGQNGGRIDFEGPSLRSLDPRNDRVLADLISKLETTKMPYQDFLWSNLVSRFKTHRLKGNRSAFKAFITADASMEVAMKLSNMMTNKDLDDRSLLDDENHIDLSQIVTQDDFFSLIGTPESIQGAKSKGKLQRILESTKEGGVILFRNYDQMGEAGPVFLKKLLPYISGNRVRFPNGQSYDLTNKVMIFSTPKGADIFGIVTNEEYRNKLWKKDRKKNQSEMLRSVGVPEQLIKESHSYVAKPMTEAEAISLGKSLLKELEQQFEMSIHADDTFWEKKAKIFFNPDFADERILQLFRLDLSNLLTRVSIATAEKNTAYRPLAKSTTEIKGKVEVRLSISDDALENYPKWTDWDENTFEARTTIVNAETIQDGKKVGDISEDVSTTSIPFTFNRKFLKLMIAFHEIGHALGVSIPVLNGLPAAIMEHTTIKPVQLKRMSAAGVAFSTPIIGGSSLFPRASKIEDMATTAAGTVAEWLYNGRPGEGWGSDRESINRYSEETILTNRVVNAQDADNRSEAIQQKIDTEREKLMMEAYLAALGKIQHNYRFWEEASAVLADQESISQDQFFAIGNKIFDDEFPIPEHTDNLSDCVKLFL